MNATTPTFRTLSGRPAWPTGRRSSVSVSARDLGLESLPTGPLALAWGDGSLGGLTLPRGFALDGRSRLYLLDPFDEHDSTGQRIRRYQPRSRTFEPLPALGGWGSDPRRFRNASNISIAGTRLFIADTGNRRVQVMSLDTGHLLYVWPLDDEAATDADAGLDVASAGETTFILDGSTGRVFRHLPGEDEPTPVIRASGAQRWSRIAIDLHGRTYLFDPVRGVLDVYDEDGHRQEVADAGDVRDRFEPPALTLIHDQRGGASAQYFRIPAAVAAGHEGLIFDRRGRQAQIAAADRIEPKRYREHGTWISSAIDSGIHACQWHRLDVQIPRLPPGTEVVVSTFASDLGTGHPHEGSPLWQPCLRACREGPHDALVQSREGQYLWVSVQLKSDGFDTPRVQSLDAHFPRDSYLRFLPAVYSADDEGRWFLERFLSIVQTEWDDIEQRVRDVRRYFDVDATPASGGWLETLGRWMAVQLEQTWTPEQKRNLLRVSKRLLGRRGTAAGLRAFVQAYLQNMTGLSPERQANWPVILEGFRQRNHVLAGATRTGRAAAAALWSDSVVGRPQLDVFSQEGAMRLVSTGDPGRDLFHTYSHRFTVSVPAAWVRSADDERMLRRAIDAEKPAHTAYELRLVPSRFRVGVQSTVGVDTILGDRPRARLAGGCGSDRAPGRPPHSRLGYDTVLGGAARPPRPVQIPHSRIGLDTILN